MKKQILTTVLLIFVISTCVTGSLPRILSYQGVVTDTNGNPKKDGEYKFTFSIFDDSVSGESLWSEEKTIQTKQGLFSTELGSVEPLTIPFDKQYWLQVEADGTVFPLRTKLTSAPYSFRADTAEIAKGLVDSFYTREQLRTSGDASVHAGNIVNADWLISLPNSPTFENLYVKDGGVMDNWVRLGRTHVHESPYNRLWYPVFKLNTGTENVVDVFDVKFFGDRNYYNSQCVLRFYVFRYSKDPVGQLHVQIHPLGGWPSNGWVVVDENGTVWVASSRIWGYIYTRLIRSEYKSGQIRFSTNAVDEEPTGTRIDGTFGIVAWDGDAGEVKYHSIQGGNIYSNGNLVWHSGNLNPETQSSDIRFKTDIDSIQDPLKKVNALKGISFNWKHSDFPDRHFTEGGQIGVIAQEVERILPEVVRIDKDGYKSVAYDKLSAILIEAVKEQQKIIETQENKIENQKTEIDSIKNGFKEMEKIIYTIKSDMEKK